jgi:hypothetical protein
VIHACVRELETLGAGALSAFNKECLEKIPPAELRAIHDKALRIIDLARLSPAGPLPLGYCDKCPGEGKFRLKQPCFTFMETRESLCAYHAMERRERELCLEYLEAHGPKLDLKDFARI